MICAVSGVMMGDGCSELEVVTVDDVLMAEAGKDVEEVGGRKLV